jgi:AcrR family transcriptional regulator
MTCLPLLRGGEGKTGQLTQTVNVIYGLNMVHGKPPTPRARRHDANVVRIGEAAMTLVAEGGLGALSMGRLAEAVDYTPGALYRYFGSKDALLSHLVAQILEEVQGYLARAEALLPTGSFPLTRVFAIAQGYREYARQRPHGFGLLASAMAEPRLLLPELADAQPVLERVIATLELLAQALGDAVSAGQLEDGDVAERTLCLFATLQGLLQLHKQARFAPTLLELDRLVFAGTRSLLLGWGAKPRAVDAALETALKAEPLGAPS